MRRNADIALVGLAALLLTLPILGPYTPGGHDFLAYLMYAQQAAANMRDGVVLPAWAADLNYGFGGPSLMFYPPLVNLVHAAGLLAGIPLITVIGVLTFVSLFLSGLTARMWLRQKVNQSAAAAGAIVYMVAPYRVIDIYERTALAEHWAFIYPPLILWAIRSPRPAMQRITIAAFATAALLMTNLPLAVLFGMAIAAYVIFMEIARALTRRSAAPSPASGRGRPELDSPLPLAGEGPRSGGEGPDRRLAVATIGAFLGFSMAGLALIPQAVAARYLRVELWFGVASRYRPSSNTIFSSTANIPEFNTRVSLAVVATAILAAFAVVAMRRELDREQKFWAAVAAIAFLATIPFAGPVWDAVPLLSRLQFPWRISAVLTLAAAALIAQVSSPRVRLALIGVAAIAAAPHYGESILRRVLFQHPISPAAASRLFPDPRAIIETGAVFTNTTHERMIDVWFIPRTANLRFIDELPAPEPRLGRILQRPAIFPENEQAALRITRWRRLERAISIQVNRPGTLIWHALAFPKMQFIVDGQAAPFLVHEASGLASVALTPGRHEVVWRWRPFDELVLGRWISLAGLVVTAMIAAWAWVPHRRLKPAPRGAG